MAVEMLIEQEAYDGLDPILQGEYIERDGQFQLDVTGAFSEVDRNKLDGALKKERLVTKELRGKNAAFGDLDPEKYAGFETQIEELNATIEAGTDPEKLQTAAQKIADSKIKAATDPLHREIKDLSGQLGVVTVERDGFSSTITTGETNTAVLAGFHAEGVKGESHADADVLRWAKEAFTVDDEGNIVSTAMTGTEGLSIDDTFKDMVRNNKNAHWFGTTAGAGATGGKNGAAHKGPNPFGEKGVLNESTGNLTEAGIMSKTDPATAKRLAKQAGTERYFPQLFT